MDQTPPTKNQDQLRELVLSIQGIIECPVCDNSLDSAVIQCRNGHGICSSCAASIEKCPTCQQEFAVLKSTLLEQILQCLPKPCSYSDRGCEFIHALDMIEHETFCEYRPTTCKQDGCLWEGSVKDLIDHVRKCYDQDICEVSRLGTKMPRVIPTCANKDCNFVVPLVFQNEVFWRKIHRSSSTKVISFKFYHIPTSKPTHNYYLIVSFTKNKIEYKLSVKACRGMEYEIEVKDDNSGLIIPDSELERFLEPKSTNVYQYTIKLVTEDFA